MSKAIGLRWCQGKAGLDEITDEGDKVSPILVKFGDDSILECPHMTNLTSPYFLDILLFEPASQRDGYRRHVGHFSHYARASRISAHVKNDVEERFEIVARFVFEWFTEIDEGFDSHKRRCSLQ
jgi:hypothetical protein